MIRQFIRDNWFGIIVLALLSLALAELLNR